MIDIGEKTLVMMTGWQKMTALHVACSGGASYRIMKMLIDVGEKDLVVAKSTGGKTGLHYFCFHINEHYNPTDKIGLFLEAADTEEILQVKNIDGRTHLQIAIIAKISNEIQDLLRPRHSSTAVLEDTRHTHQVTLSKQCTASPTKLPEDTNTSHGNIRELQEQLKEAKNQAAHIQQDFDVKCRDMVMLQITLQVERAEKLLLTGSLVQKDKQIQQLQQQKEKNDEDYAFLKTNADSNTAKLCSEQENKLQEMKDAANAIGEGKKRKRDTKEHAFSSDKIIADAGDEMIMEQLQLEKEQHSKLIKQLLETRRELRLANAQLEQNTGTEAAAATARVKIE
jgi:hypothetical protein